MAPRAIPNLPDRPLGYPHEGPYVERDHRKNMYLILPQRHGQNLAVTVLHVPYSLDSLIMCLMCAILARQFDMCLICATFAQQ